VTQSVRKFRTTTRGTATRRGNLGLLILILAALFALPLPQNAQQPKPGPPAGTPGRSKPAPPDIAASGIAFAVLDFEVSRALAAKNESLGRTIADAFASSLKDKWTGTVIRKAVLFTEAELKDPRVTQTLKKELGVAVIVGGRIAESGLDVDVSAVSVRAADAVVLGSGQSRFDLTTLQVVEATGGYQGADKRQFFIVSARGQVYLRTKGSSEEVKVSSGTVLTTGDQVRCEVGGEVGIYFAGGVQFKIPCSNEWFSPQPPPQPKQAAWELRDLSQQIRSESVAAFTR